jgi:secretion/DNA translocation related TadE-like protein
VDVTRPLARDDVVELGDRGSAVVWALALVAVIIAAGFFAAAVEQQALARQRVGSAADLAALAAAQSDGEQCAADRVAVANESTLVACAIDGLDVIVRVSRPAPVLIRRPFALLGSSPRDVVGAARTGPPLTEEGGHA